jgi:hypothetical protein
MTKIYRIEMTGAPLDHFAYGLLADRRQNQRVPATRGFGYLNVLAVLEKGFGIATFNYSDVDPDALGAVMTVGTARCPRIGLCSWSSCGCICSCEQPKSVEAHTVSAKLSAGNELQRIWGNGGGGIRTPVPRCFKTSVYMRSRSIGISRHQAPSDGLSDRLFRLSFTPSSRTFERAKPTDWRPYQTRRHGLTGRVASLSCHAQL